MANLNIQTRNCQVDSDLRAHCEEKLEGVERLWPRAEEALLRFSSERGRHTAEITLVSAGMITRAEERSDNLRHAFDLAVEKLQRQLDRFKKKTQSRKRRYNNRDDVAGTVLHPVDSPATSLNGSALNAVIDNDPVDGAAAANDEEDQNVVRVKRFALKPMSAEEATLQMDLLGHEFFVFRDAANNEVSVVYRRRSGGYGLIEPVAD